MSVEGVLRGIDHPDADKLAAAWRDHERRQDERHNALRLDIDKAIARSTLSVTAAGLTLAALLAASVYLGAVGERVGTVKEQADKILPRLDQLDARLQASGGLLRQIDERTKRMDRAAATPAPSPEGNLTAYEAELAEKIRAALAAAARGEAVESADSASRFDLAGLVGWPVSGRDGEPLGRVASLGVDAASGEIQRLVIASGNFLGLGPKNIAVEFSDLELRPEGSGLVAKKLTRAAVPSLPEYRETLEGDGSDSWRVPEMGGAPRAGSRPE